MNSKVTRNRIVLKYYATKHFFLNKITNLATFILSDYVKQICFKRFVIKVYMHVILYRIIIQF